MHISGSKRNQSAVTSAHGSQWKDIIVLYASIIICAVVQRAATEVLHPPRTIIGHFESVSMRRPNRYTCLETGEAAIVNSLSTKFRCRLLSSYEIK